MNPNIYTAASHEDDTRHQISVRIPRHLLETIDKYCKGNRSNFIIKALEAQIALEEQKSCLKRITGSFTPDTFDGEEAIAFVDKLRWGDPG